MTGIVAVDVFIWIGSAGAGLSVLAWLARSIWRANKRLVHIADAVNELCPNSGESVRDRVVRIDRSVIELTRRFDEHLERHR